MELLRMKYEGTLSLCTAILSVAFLSSTIQSNAQSGAAGAGSNTSVEHSASLRMVSAQTVLNKSLEGKNVKAGQEIEVSLVQKVRLNDGQELPKGTVLVGTIVASDMQSKGNSKLGFRFAQARTKEGKTIPIQAVIIGLYDQGSLNAQYGNNGWEPGQVNIQQEKAAGGLTLRSQVGAADSGTLESKKDDVKIDRGSALFLAIAPAEGSGAANSGK
jgi:hypothetical protein